VAGNMGSDFRFNYSILGDTVNVASRLEARTKDYRIPIVIGAQTEQQAKEKFATMEIDRIQVKGKAEPETVFTVLGRAELRHQELRELTTRMLRSYREQVLGASNRSNRALPQGWRTVRHRRAL
jgi:adenylate cyclase